ncbi:uncharacterized protein BXZ73DRAFT_49470 [Epithele typhae]|uniref:uncharacterized protein n=1 Tax=Epithele typhae TaxID=378194 RepID=UPI002007A89B|nr:uncharacterized protein BXZ73DRAFT_49470 [Epithele typhae]KAH9926243.1 hypothetical protein BXZ73DRAFT_49470 [Epithele typhae]
MPIPDLPNETLCAIFDLLPPPALASVVRASHRFHLVAERVLYTSIAIADALPPPPAVPVPYRTAICAATILARPHLGPVVRRLAVRWLPDPALRDRDDALDALRTAVAPALVALNHALRTLLALEHLDLAFGLAGALSLAAAARAPLDARAVLDGCAFPALRAFALSGVGRGSLSHKLYAPDPDDAAAGAASIAAFLARAPALEELHLHDCYEALALPPAAAPRLQAFRGPALAAAGVLPGRPVRVLALVGHEFVTARDLAGLARASVPVRWLDLGAMGVTPLLLRDVSRHLSAVEVLKVRLALRHTLHHALSGISLLAGLTHVLGAFPALAQLDLSPTAVDGVGRGNALEESALCTTWARACPALRAVVFPSRTEWRRAAPDDVWVAAAGGAPAVWTRY